MLEFVKQCDVHKLDFVFLEFYDTRFIHPSSHQQKSNRCHQTVGLVARSYFRVVCDNEEKILSVGSRIAEQLLKLKYGDHFSITRTKKEKITYEPKTTYYNEYTFEKTNS